jgi:hypothetical protein
MRLQTTSFLISEGWWDHGRRRWTTATFRYLDQVEFTRPDDAHLDSRSMLRVVLPGEIAKSVRAGYLKPLNARLMQALKQPTTRALYGLLDARRHHPQHPRPPPSTSSTCPCSTGRATAASSTNGPTASAARSIPPTRN